MIDLNLIMKELAKSRPAFHSEADFQHSLAWTIQRNFPNVEIRLEIVSQRQHLDLLVIEENIKTAIELKYKTARARFVFGDETIDLSNHSARDINRFAFLKDINRVELFLERGIASKGFVIFLTNDSGYWRPSKKSEAIDSAFKMHEGNKLEGKLGWSEKASSGTKGGLPDFIELGGSYELIWQKYSRVDEARNSEFRFLMITLAD